MSLIEEFLLPEWSCSHILLETYIHSSPEKDDEFRERFAQFANNISNKCCVRLANIVEKELPINSYLLLPHEDNFRVQYFKNISTYPPNTYLMASAPMGGDQNDLDEAMDIIASHVGLVRVLWGPRAAWSLVQRSIIDCATGNMVDPGDEIAIPNAFNKVWDEVIDKEKLTQVLTNSSDSEKILRSLRLVYRGSDATGPDKQLWFWSAMEILCGVESEKGISEALSLVYEGSPDRYREIQDKFGTKLAAKARHHAAHKGFMHKHGSEVTEYYIALYIDLLSGLYLGNCVRRAESMIEQGFDPQILGRLGDSVAILGVHIEDDGSFNILNKDA